MEVIDLVYQEELVAFIELRCNSDLDLRKIHARLVGRELAFWHRVPPRRTDISQIQAEDTFQLADGLRKCIGTTVRSQLSWSLFDGRLRRMLRCDGGPCGCGSADCIAQPTRRRVYQYRPTW